MPTGDDSMIHDFVKFQRFSLLFVDNASTSSSSGGNQVDGLPPAAHMWGKWSLVQGDRTCALAGTYVG